jgi:CBS domain-containing protein
MKVEDIMTRTVVTVSPEVSIHEAARLMVEHHVSGLPVVDGSGRVTGILSEGDLIIRQRGRPRLPWWRAFFLDGERLAREYQKAEGTTVAEVMTRAVIWVSPDLPVSAAAAVLEHHRIRRAPVIAAGVLVGIVSRGDLVKALAAAPAPPVVPASDARLVAEMRARLAREPWVSSLGMVIQARDGVLAIWGLVPTAAQKAAVETMARSVAGVKGIESHIVAESEIAYGYGAV